MAKNRFQNKRQKPRRSGASSPPPAREPARPLARSIPIEYGKPFILLEDESKNTFEFKGGAWVPYALSIAQCREECQVKELPQKVNRMTRYEIRCPLSS
jgi:hypothetical protein